MNPVPAKANDLATQHGLRLEMLQSCTGLLVSVWNGDGDAVAFAYDRLLFS